MHFGMLENRLFSEGGFSRQMAQTRFDFPPAPMPEGADRLRAEVRQFLAAERAAGRLTPNTRITNAFDAEFSRACGERGYIGMTWPKQYGGGERSALERYILTEELLAGQAPVRGHWVADRQSGPVILRFGTDRQRDEFLPRIARGEAFFCIGLSEPNSGSDLSSVSTKARQDGDDWVIDGAKLWTTSAHHAHFMIALCRTARDPDDRYHGLSQFIIDMATPGVTVRPIINMAGEHDFNEVIFDGARLPASALLGTLHEGWKQVSAELAYERSGPDRWLSAFGLLSTFNAAYAARLDAGQQQALGRLIAHLLTLREMSMSIAGMLQSGRTPNVEAAIVKDLGTHFEQELIKLVRDLVATAPDAADPLLRRLLESAILTAPSFTIRGGTTEMLRGTIARGLGLR